MPEYLAPGVYVEEIEIGAKPIEGVSTSTAGFLGQAERGPTNPRLVTGFEEFQRLYGGHIKDSYLAYAIEGFFRNGGKRCFICRIVGKGAKEASLDLNSPPVREVKPPKKPEKKPEEKPEEPETTTNPGNPGQVMAVSAIGPGTWGNRIAVNVEDATMTSMIPELFRMTVYYWREEPPASLDPKEKEPTMVEVYDNLSPDPTSSDNYERKINGISNLIEVERKNDRRPSNTDFKLLSGGEGGASIVLSDYQGNPLANPGERSGLVAFQEVDEISIVAAPDENAVSGLTDAIIDHCENMKDRFAIIQSPQSAGPVGKLFPPRDSKYAGFYYPWIKTLDPLTNTYKLVPPGGHVAGIYARSDEERGVHKAPANEVVRGATELQFPISKGDQDILNPRGVNCIRAFPGRGIRVWGARTTSSDALWKYINVRRLFLFLEESIEEGTQWVVFEPNDERLWARVIGSVTEFLERVWRDGALMGITREEAFFVKCDRTTMTQDDIDNGRLIVMIGVAPVKPAEFVIFRIAQWPGGSEVTE